jgi:growth factor-regulated tyrosine kinase substrate
MNGFEFPPIDEAKAMFLAESAPDWAEGDNCYRLHFCFAYAPLRKELKNSAHISIQYDTIFYFINLARCRAEFGVFTRKHHCRACGQIFCDRCSSKQMLLPNFGIEKKVRVCEACFDKKQTQQASKVSFKETCYAIKYSLTCKEQGKSPLDSKTEEEAREKALKDAEVCVNFDKYLFYF